MFAGSIMLRGRIGTDEVEDFDRVADRVSLVFREAGAFVFALFAAWFLINHRAFFTFPPDLSEAEGAAWQTYVFLAVLLDAGLHVAFFLLSTGPTERVPRAPRLGVASVDVAAMATRPDIARRPPRAALAESRTRGVEAALELRRAIATAQRQWENVVAREAMDDLATFLEAENPDVPLPIPTSPENPPLRPIRVMRRVIRTEPGRSLRTPSPGDLSNDVRPRPGERIRPKS